MHWLHGNLATPDQLEHGLHAIDGGGTYGMLHRTRVDFCCLRIESKHLDEECLDNFESADNALGYPSAGRRQPNGPVSVVDEQTGVF